MTVEGVESDSLICEQAGEMERARGERGFTLIELLVVVITLRFHKQHHLRPQPN